MTRQERSIANFVDQLAQKFSFSSSKEKSKFEEQINEEVSEIIENSRNEMDQKNNELGQLEGDLLNDKDTLNGTAEKTTEIVQNSKNNSTNDTTDNTHGMRQSTHDLLRSSQQNIQNNDMDDLETQQKKSNERMKLLTKYENKFLECVKHKYEKFFVEVGFVPFNIWTIKVYPNDNKFYDNTPIVLLHGFGAGICQWVKMFDVLSERRIVYAIDMPGFGKSSRPRFNSDEGHNLTSMIEYLELWRLSIEGLDKPFILLGHSLGSYMAMAYAIRHSQHINNLILLDPWGIYCHESDMQIDRASFDRRLRKYRVTEVIGSFISPMSVMRNTGRVGKYLFKKIRDDLYYDFADTIDQETFYKYWIKCNAAIPATGEQLMHSLETNLFFAKHPMIKFASKLPERITIRVFVGMKGFVGRFNATLKDQLESAIGPQRLKFSLLEQFGHHFYGSNEFIEMLSKISLSGLNDES